VRFLDMRLRLGQADLVRPSFRLFALFALLVGCSADQFSTPSDAAVSEAGVDAADAGTDAKPTSCSLDVPWRSPVLLKWDPTSNGSPIPFPGTVRFDRDENVAVFDDGNSGIYLATRNQDVFVGKKTFPVPLTESAFHPTLDGPGKRLWFAYGGRIAVTAADGSSSIVDAALEVGFELAFPYALPGGNVLYAANGNPTSPLVRYTIDVATGKAQGTPQVPLGYEKWPANFQSSGPNRPLSIAVSADELEMVFGNGNVAATAHVFVSRRASTSVAWPTPVPLDLGPNFTPETPNWISVDRCRLYVRGYVGSQRVVAVATRPN
jgi:hypothetical protein